jgi:hypothetical protein
MTTADRLVYDAPFFQPSNAWCQRLWSSQRWDGLDQADRKSPLSQRSVQ